MSIKKQNKRRRGLMNGKPMIGFRIVRKPGKARGDLVLDVKYTVDSMTFIGDFGTITKMLPPK